MNIQLNDKTTAPGLYPETVSKDHINDFWSKGAEGYDKSVWRAIQSERQKKAWQGIFKTGLGDEKLKILDVGTGPGIVALLLADMGHMATGVDRSEEMLKMASNNAVKLDLHVDFKKGDAEKLPFENESFDAVINRHVLWTLTDPEKALREWKRVLKPGGRLVIIDGNWRLNNSSINYKVWNVLSMLIITLTERRNGFAVRSRHEQEWKYRMPLASIKRPEYDIEKLKALGFEDFGITWIKHRQMGLVEHLKYGYSGDTFQISAKKSRSADIQCGNSS